jgi:hypothetical protein
MSSPAEVRTAQSKRLGVHAARRFEAGANIERAPVVVFPAREAWILGRTGLLPYLEPWQPPSGKMALPLGYGALYRDNDEPNAKFVARTKEMAIDIVALRDIEVDDEIIVSRLEDTGPLVSDITLSSLAQGLLSRLGLRNRRATDKM